MIPKECKRLAEVDFPIAVVSKYSVKEKAVKHGHPSGFTFMVGKEAACSVPCNVAGASVA